MEESKIEDVEIKKGGRDIKDDEWAKEDFTIRKKYELKLMRKFDKTKINTGKECWFLVDSLWLNRWSEFINTDSMELPGPISSSELLDGNGNPIAGLKAKQDYRAISPISYFILKQLHGSDGSPDLPRYVLDIYKPAVPVERLVGIQMSAVCEANVQINKYRSKWMKWEIPFEEDEEIGNFWCCGLTKEHLEAFIFWAVNCWRWSRKSSGRNDIKYRQYRPLKGIPDETIHGNSRHGNEDQEMQPIRSSHGDALDDSTHNVIHEASSRGSGRARSNTSTSVKSEGVGVGRYINQHGDRDDDDEDCIDEDSSSEEEMGVAPADVNHHRGRWLNEMLR